jgi:uncharacterized protein (DUF1330 family)
MRRPPLLKRAPWRSFSEAVEAGVAIEVSEGELNRFVAADPGRPFVLLQLLRFAEGGREKYLEYSAAAQPILLRLGAKVLYAGECVAPSFAGTEKAWDAVIVVRYPARAAYAGMLADPAWQALVQLRSSSLREALLLPMDDWGAR